MSFPDGYTPRVGDVLDNKGDRKPADYVIVAIDDKRIFAGRFDVIDEADTDNWYVIKGHGMRTKDFVLLTPAIMENIKPGAIVRHWAQVDSLMVVYKGNGYVLACRMLTATIHPDEWQLQKRDLP